MTSEKLAAAIGSRLRERRTKYGWSQRAFGEKIGIQKEHLSRFENGHAYPSTVNLMVMATALEVSVADLLGLE